MTKIVQQKIIPKGWQYQKLGFFGTCIRGVSYSPTDLRTTKDNSSVVLLRSNNIKDKSLNFKEVQIISKAKVKSDQLIQKRDIFICMSSGSKNLVGKSVCIKNNLEHYTVGAFCAIYRITKKNKVCGDFIEQLFDSNKYISQIQDALQGTSINNLKNSQIENLVFLFPSINEQKKIAEILSAVDEVIQKTVEIISQTERLKKGLMQELFTKGIGHKKFKKTKIGSVPEEWEVKTLNDLVSHVGSGATPRGGSSIYLTDGIPFIRSQNVYFNGLRTNDLVYISESINKKMNRSIVRKGDVLLNITGASIGRACVFPDNFQKANVNQHVCIIRPTDLLDNIFLFYFLQSKFGQSQIFSLQAGGNRQGLNFQNIRSFKIMLPPLMEQKKIVEVLSVVDERVSINTKYREILLKLKNGLMQDLLSGKKRVINH